MNKKYFSYLGIITLPLLTTLQTYSTAQAEWDKASEEALQQTQTLLKDQSQLKKAAAENSSAQASLDQMSQISSNPKHQSEIQSLAADIFGTLAKDSGGDPSLIMSKLMNGLKDPNSLTGVITPAQMAELKRIAAEIEADNKKK